MNLRMLGDNIALKLQPGAGRIGMIIIPDSQRSTRSQTFQTAKVVGEVGKNVKRVTRDSLVLVSEYFGDEVEVDGEKIRVGRERDIVGVVVNAGQPGEMVCCAGDRMLLEPLEDAQRVGAIYLPEERKVRDLRGRVVSAGPECEAVARGDTVLYPPKRAAEVRWGGKVLHLIEEPAAHCVL